MRVVETGAETAPSAESEERGGEGRESEGTNKDKDTSEGQNNFLSHEVSVRLSFIGNVLGALLATQARVVDTSNRNSHFSRSREHSSAAGIVVDVKSGSIERLISSV